MLDFFDLSLHLRPRPETETEASAEELIKTARRFGYAGVAVTNHNDYAEIGAGAGESSNFAYKGIEIRADSVAVLKRKIKIYYGRVAVLAVHGGDEKINEAALQDYRVDILAHPCGEFWRGKGKGRGEGKGGGLNHVLVRYAAENGVALDFNMNAIIQSRGRGERARVLRKMRENLKLVRKYDALPVLTSHAETVYDLRAPREMVALAGLFGMTREEAVRALSEVPRGILEKRWKRWKKGREVEVL